MIEPSMKHFYLDEVKDDAGTPGGGASGDQPKGDQPKGDQPKDDQPKGDQPKGDQPKGDQPKGDQPKGDAGKPAAKGAPASYDFSAKAPKDVPLDQETVTQFSGVAKELGLTQEQADKIFDLGVKMTEKQAAALTEHVNKTREGWVQAVKTDKDIGGANLDQNLAVAKRAISAFDTNGELVKFLNESGLGDNPVLIKTFVKIGKAISNDKLVTGRQGSSQPASGLMFSYSKSKHAA